MSTIRTNAILDSAGGNTATINGIPLRQGVLDPENRIINGAFDFWQRGTSSSSAGYLADRWFNTHVGGTFSTSRQSFAAGDTLGSNSPTFFVRQTISGQTLASHYAGITQPIEGVRSYAGQTITILGWARRSSGSGNMAVSIDQYFGTGGSPSATVVGNGQTVTLTGSWAPFALTFSIPSIAGKTIGTNNNDYVSPIFWISAGSDRNGPANSLGLQTIGVDLWGIHIKLGTHTTAAVDLYKQPELGPELARCQRYYRRVTTDVQFQGIASGVFSGPTAGEIVVSYPVRMRGNPTVSMSNLRLANGSVGSDATSLSTSYIGSSSALITVVAGSVFAAGNPANLIGRSAAGGYLDFDAEL